MATRTSVGSGNWSAPGTWDTGVPIDGDDVVIASGHTVTFDVDQSDFTIGVKITITGTLNHALTGGPYKLFLKAGAGAITGTGTWNVGTSANPIPFAVKHTITGGAGWGVTGNATTGLTCTIYGTEPAHQWVRLSANEAAGQTELSIDTDITGEANYWKAGDKVLISTNKGCAEVEERTIISATSNTLTINSGLSAAKNIGDHIVLLTRNVTILQVATGNGFWSFLEGKLTIGSCAISTHNNYMLNGCEYPVISGGVFYYGGTYNGGAIYSNTGIQITGGVFTGMNRVIYSTARARMSGGLICGCNQPFNGAGQMVITGGKVYGNKVYDLGMFYYSDGLRLLGGTFEKAPDSILGVIAGDKDVYINGATFLNNVGVFGENCWNIQCASATFTGNTYIFRRHCSGKMHGATFTGTTTEWDVPTNIANGSILEILDYGGTSGAYKAWCGAGVITSQSSVVPSGYAQANLMTLNANGPEISWYPVGFSVAAGHSVSIEVQLRKSVSMTNLPKVFLSYEKNKPETLDGSELDSFTMTNSTNTWESDTFTIDNTAGDKQLDYKLTFYVYRQTSGNVYSAYKITDTTPSSGGGGSVKILPLGRIGL